MKLTNTQKELFSESLYQDSTGRINFGVLKGYISKAVYNENPNRCLTCKIPILVSSNQKLAEIIKKKFCSHSCAAKHNNSIRVRKQTKKYYCKYCQVTISNKWTAKRVCKDCYYKFVSADFKTIGESSHSKIRCHARNITNKRKQICANCNYDKFVETCHIEPIKNFSKDTLLIIVNDPKNLILLCPNCHWEFDHNKLDLEQIINKPDYYI